MKKAWNRECFLDDQNSTKTDCISPATNLLFAEFQWIGISTYWVIVNLVIHQSTCKLMNDVTILTIVRCCWQWTNFVSSSNVDIYLLNQLRCQDFVGSAQFLSLWPMMPAHDLPDKSKQPRIHSSALILLFFLYMRYFVVVVAFLLFFVNDVVIHL